FRHHRFTSNTTASIPTIPPPSSTIRQCPLADHLWDNWEDHRVHLISRSEPATFRGETTQEYEMWFQTVSHPFIIDPDHLDAPLPRDDVVVNIETATALLDQFVVARRMEDDAEELKFFRRMMKDVGPLIDHRLSRRKPSKGPTPDNRVQREADGLRYDDSEKDYNSSIMFCFVEF
ncbi:hypothetical protein KSS87_014287, partial [Heliosperma pusillum]